MKEALLVLASLVEVLYDEQGVNRGIEQCGWGDSKSVSCTQEDDGPFCTKCGFVVRE